MTKERFVHLRTLTVAIAAVGLAWLLILTIQILSLNSDIKENEKDREASSLRHFTDAFACADGGATIDPDLVAGACDKASEVDVIAAKGTSMKRDVHGKRRALWWPIGIIALGVVGAFWVYSARRLSGRLAASVPVGEPANTPVHGSPRSGALADRLADIEKAKASGLVSDEEYAASRRRILDDA